MQYDLIIRNAQLHRHSRIVDIAVKDGRFVKIAGDLLVIFRQIMHLKSLMRRVAWSYRLL